MPVVCHLSEVISAGSMQARTTTSSCQQRGAAHKTSANTYSRCKRCMARSKRTRFGKGRERTSRDGSTPKTNRTPLDGTKVSACSSAHGHEPRAMARPGVSDSIRTRNRGVSAPCPCNACVHACACTLRACVRAKCGGAAPCHRPPPSDQCLPPSRWGPCCAYERLLDPGSGLWTVRR